MPTVFLERLPLPSLRTYVSLTLFLILCSVYYAIQVTSRPEWKLNVTLNTILPFFTNRHLNVTLSKIQDITLEELLIDHPFVKRVCDIVYFMIQEPLCIWTLINLAYCILILVGKVIQRMVFGELRVSEQQHLKDKFWNFVFYKFIFIFGVINVQYMDEVVLWCSWFSVLGFLHLLAQLCKDRFEYLSFSPSAVRWTHVRLFLLLLGILGMSFALFGVCVMVGLHSGLNTFSFMVAECLLVTVRSLYVMARYVIYLWDVTHHHEGVWERRAVYIYYTELVFELAAFALDFVHHLHMLLWGNIFLSMASLVICMQMRYLFYEIQRRFKRHKNYLRVVRHMENNFPMATPEELERNKDDCAICWDHMEAARKLPCGHLFHNSCLTSWMEQDTSCPTCRKAFTTDQHPSSSSGANAANLPPQPQPATTNHFFHFDGSRYVSWFPSFSVEVSTRTALLGERAALETSQLDNMAREVQQMFPHMPLGLLLDDLRATRSIEQTVENILEERLVPPPVSMFQSLRTSTPSQQSLSTQAPEPLEADQEASNSSSTFFQDDEDWESSTSGGQQESRNGSRFSKSSCERENMLARRKEEMVQQARRRYLARKRNENSEAN